MNNVTLFEAARLLLMHDDYLILIHERPDGDAVGSAEALRRALRALDKRASVFSPDRGVPEYLFSFLGAPLVKDPAGKYTYISVDVAESALFGQYAAALEGKVLLKLDHHRVGRDFAQYNYTDPEASAAGEIVWELVDLLGVCDRQIASMIYVAIASDTGCFRYSNTTAKTLSIASKLYETGIDAASLNTRLFESKDRKTVQATALGIEKTRFTLGGKIAFCTVTNEMRDKYGFEDEHLGELPSALREIKGVELVVVLKEDRLQPGKYRLSTRSKSWFDCAALCATLDGGGHLRAAGGGVYARSAAEAEEIVERQIEKLWKN